MAAANVAAQGATDVQKSKILFGICRATFRSSGRM